MPQAVRRHQADRPAAHRRRRLGRQERAENAILRRGGGKTIVVKFDWKPDVRKVPAAPGLSDLISFTPKLPPDPNPTVLDDRRRNPQAHRGPSRPARARQLRLQWLADEFPARHPQRHRAPLRQVHLQRRQQQEARRQGRSRSGQAVRIRGRPRLRPGPQQHHPAGHIRRRPQHRPDPGARRPCRIRGDAAAGVGRRVLAGKHQALGGPRPAAAHRQAGGRLRVRRARASVPADGFAARRRRLPACAARRRRHEDARGGARVRRQRQHQSRRRQRRRPHHGRHLFLDAGR